jgi:trehalose 6-phosphate phosphatase
MTCANPPVPTNIKEIAILLDVDGTIIDLALTPDDVRVPSPLPETLAQLSALTGGALALVSGRPVRDLDELFAPLKLPVIGGHGAEFRLRNTELISNYPPLDPAIRQRFAEIAKIDPGIVVEDKEYSLALHYRLVPDRRAAVLEAAAEILAEFPSAPIELLPGKAMIEVKKIGYDKASAVRKLMTYMPFAARRPIMIGDDVTDESMFAVAPEYQGVAISVGRKRAHVSYQFERPADVRRWLEQTAQAARLPING